MKQKGKIKKKIFMLYIYTKDKYLEGYKS